MLAGDSLDSEIELSLEIAEESSKIDFIRENLDQNQFDLKILFGKIINQFSINCRREHDSLQNWNKRTKEMLGILNIRLSHLSSPKSGLSKSQSADLSKEFYFRYLQGPWSQRGAQASQMSSFCSDLADHVELVSGLNKPRGDKDRLRRDYLDGEIRRLHLELGRMQANSEISKTGFLRVELTLADLLFAGKGPQKACDKESIWFLDNKSHLEYSVCFLK